MAVGCGTTSFGCSATESAVEDASLNDAILARADAPVPEARLGDAGAIDVPAGDDVGTADASRLTDAEVPPPDSGRGAAGMDAGTHEAGDAGHDAEAGAGAPDAADPCAADEYEPNDARYAARAVFALTAPVAVGSPYDSFAMTWSAGDAEDWIAGTVESTGPVVRVTAVADEGAGPPTLAGLVTIAIS